MGGQVIRFSGPLRFTHRVLPEDVVIVDQETMAIIQTGPLCAGCGREIGAGCSLCESCEYEMMSQGPSWLSKPV